MSRSNEAVRKTDNSLVGEISGKKVFGLKVIKPVIGRNVLRVRSLVRLATRSAAFRSPGF